MKKLLVISLLLGLIFSLCGCSLLYEGQNNALDNETLAKIVAENLGVPSGTACEVRKTCYWEAAGRDFKNVTFTENGEMVELYVERETFETNGKEYFSYFIKGVVRGKEVKLTVAPPYSNNQ